MRNDADLDANWGFGLELLHALVDGRSHRHHVATLHRGDTEAHGRLPIVAHYARRRLLVGALDRHQVFEPDRRELPVALRDGDDEPLEVIHGLDCPAREDTHILVVNSDLTSILSLVLPGNNRPYHLGRDAEIRHLRPRHLERDDLLLVPEKVDLRHVGAEKKLAPEKLRVFL